MYNRVIDNEPQVIVKVKNYKFEKKSSKTSANINFFEFFSVRFPQRQDSYDVTDIVSHIVAVFLANIDKKRVNRCYLKSFKQFVLNK